MVAISVKLDISGFEQKLAALKKNQIPYATALALNNTMFDINNELKREMSKRFQGGATQYTLRAFKVTKARSPGNLQASIKLRNDAPAKGTPWDKSLGHLFDGGNRAYKRPEGAFRRIGALPSGYIAVPGSGCPLDSFGNPPRGLIVQLISYFNGFSEVGHKANMTDKRRKTLAKAGKSSGGYKTINGVMYFLVGVGKQKSQTRHLHPGIYAKSGIHGSTLKTIFLFVKMGSWKKVIDLEKMGQDVVSSKFPTHWRAALEKAVATGK